jgi:hypothetical protein
MSEEKKENWKTVDLAGIKVEYLPWKFWMLRDKIATVLGFGIATVAGILMLLD